MLRTSKEIKQEISEVNLKMTKWKNVPLVNIYYKMKFDKLVRQYALTIQFELKHKKK
jgi:hypothetical protein